MKENANTDVRQERAIIALLATPTIGSAAKAAEISEVTLWRWMKESEFKANLRDARRAVVEGAIGRLENAATDAVDALHRNLTCGTPSVEVGAATVILDQAIRAVELFDVVERVERLEARPEAPGGAGAES